MTEHARCNRYHAKLDALDCANMFAGGKVPKCFNCQQGFNRATKHEIPIEKSYGMKQRRVFTKAQRVRLALRLMQDNSIDAKELQSTVKMSSGMVVTWTERGLLVPYKTQPRRFYNAEGLSTIFENKQVKPVLYSES